MGKSKVKEEAGEDESKMELDDTAETAPLEPSAEKEEYEELCRFITPIAQPLAPRKLAKKLYKLIGKSIKEKDQCRQGIVDVQRALRREETGLVVLAGNVTPIDVYCHVAGVCEERELPYVYTPSKEHLGLACGHRRPTVVLLVRPNAAYQSLFDDCAAAAANLPLPTL